MNVPLLWPVDEGPPFHFYIYYTLGKVGDRPQRCYPGFLGKSKDEVTTEKLLDKRVRKGRTINRGRQSWIFLP